MTTTAKWQPTTMRIVIGMTSRDRLLIGTIAGKEYWSDGALFAEAKPPRYLARYAGAPVELDRVPEDWTLVQEARFDFETVGVPARNFTISASGTRTIVPVDVFRRGDGAEINVDARYVAYAIRALRARHNRPRYMPNFTYSDAVIFNSDGELVRRHCVIAVRDPVDLSLFAVISPRHRLPPEKPC